MNYLPLCATCAILALASPFANAHPPLQPYPQDAPKLMLSAALSVGGDDLASADYEYGGDDDLEAGSGIYLGAGVEFPFTTSDMALRTSVGYQFDSINADDGDASFGRIPWEFMVLLGPGPHRLGIGLAYHTDVHYDYNDDYGLDFDVDFEDATGLVLAYEYRFAPFFGLAVRYTDIEYEQGNVAPEMNPKEIDGSNIGIAAHFIF